MCVGLMENEVDALVNLLIPATMRWTSRDTRAFLEKKQTNVMTREGGIGFACKACVLGHLIG